MWDVHADIPVRQRLAVPSLAGHASGRAQQHREASLSNLYLCRTSMREWYHTFANNSSDNSAQIRNNSVSNAQPATRLGRAGARKVACAPTAECPCAPAHSLKMNISSIGGTWHHIYIQRYSTYAAHAHTSAMELQHARSATSRRTEALSTRVLSSIRCSPAASDQLEHHPRRRQSEH